MIDVSETAKGFYLSYDSMLDLGIIARNFPAVGAASPCRDKTPRTGLVDAVTHVANPDGCESDDDQGKGNCPQRSVVPGRPASLPLEQRQDEGMACRTV
jgi:hypothetical protein